MKRIRTVVCAIQHLFVWTVEGLLSDGATWRRER